jgi:cytochrome c peroxidase
MEALDLVLGVALAIAATGCQAALDSAVTPGGLSRADAYRRAQALASLGREMFSDTALSASGRISCASCHSPARAFGPPNARAVQTGGALLQRAGARAVPSLMYLEATPPFTEHFFAPDADADESLDNGPTGGLTWDGRVDRGRDQARIPLLSPVEMANETPGDVVKTVSRARYAQAFRRLYGPRVFDDERAAFAAVANALEAYQQDEPAFYPYSSKYDRYLAGTASLTAQEARGLALFDDPAKGNCAHCHVSARSKEGTAPQFTDYGLVAIGVPRNPDIPANGDPSYFDLGLCGPLRTDFRDKPEYCGRFKTPSLRNVATRQTFFHNGAIHTLREAVAFYAQRDSRPERWYPRTDRGDIRKFDDLPARYAGNVNVEAPFGQRPGDPPRLSDEQIDDVVVFLQTLTDDVGAESSPPAPIRGRSVRNGALR